MEFLRAKAPGWLIIDTTINGGANDVIQHYSIAPPFMTGQKSPRFGL
jgi:hypothetical protein